MIKSYKYNTKRNILKFDITKVANVIVYMLDNNVQHLNDKKLSVLLFLMDYNHLDTYKEKIFGDEYIKSKRNPEPKVLGDIFDILANDLDLDEEDDRRYIITELLDYVDIHIFEKDSFIELKFIKMDEEFDKSLFSRKEMKTIDSLIEKYKNDTARKVANATFQKQKVRDTAMGELII
jgi:hypothetical protein